MRPRFVDKIADMLYFGAKGAAQEGVRIVQGTLNQMKDDLLPIPLEVDVGVISAIGGAFAEIGPSLAEAIIVEPLEETEPERAAREFEEQLQAFEDEKNDVVSELHIREDMDELEQEELLDSLQDEPLGLSEEDQEFDGLLSELENDISDDSTNSDDSDVDDLESDYEEVSSEEADDSSSYDSGYGNAWDSDSGNYSGGDYDSGDYGSGYDGDE